jgi:NAD(P)-dependent dehydrogenase (short-subunit alcohol dehydrogenase family)
VFNYEPPADLLKDKTILVTGAGSGIGRAASLAYAKVGATVILLGSKTGKLETVYDEIEKAGGAQPAITPLDLETAGEEQYLELITSIDNTFGKLDGLLNNAGFLGPLMPFQTMTMTHWQKIMQINLNSAFALTKFCFPLLQQGENPSVVFSSSTAGRKAFAYSSAYTVAKHGIETLMQVLFLELENTSSIRVNTVNPGPCATALRRAAYPAEDPATLPKPEDLMSVYLYLMGKDSLGQNGKQFSAQD